MGRLHKPHRIPGHGPWVAVAHPGVLCAMGGREGAGPALLYKAQCLGLEKALRNEANINFIRGNMSFKGVIIRIN